MTKRTAGSSRTDVLQITADLAVARRPFALVIVVEAQGSASARTGTKTILDAEGTMPARWGGGGTASPIACAAIEILKGETPQLIDVDLDEEVLGAGMSASGRMRVYAEPVVPARQPQVTHKL